MTIAVIIIAFPWLFFLISNNIQECVPLPAINSIFDWTYMVLWRSNVALLAGFNIAELTELVWQLLFIYCKYIVN